MRATLSGYYRNLQFDQTKTARELFDVNKQISSGQKIQYAYEDTSVFVDAVRLDNEVTTLTQIKQNAQRALQVSSNTDTTMNDMTKVLEAMKVKLVSAANESHSNESLNAIALELRGLQKNMVALANTSIGGKYIFSGSEVTTKPIDNNGIYQGNGEAMKAFVGSGVEQTYNINGADLFLGAENDTHRKITLNVPQLNQSQLFPDVMIDPAIPRSLAKEEYITQDSTIRDMMGDIDANVDVANPKHHFYIHGVKSDGTAFKTIISKSDEDSMASLLDDISKAFGNVDVTLNKWGQIEIEDKLAGSSKLDFHMVAATDFNQTIPAPGDDANVLDIDLLDSAETDFSVIANDAQNILNNTPSAGVNPLFVKSFMQSGLSASTIPTNNIEALVYDRNDFSKMGANLLSNVSQIVKSDNSFATDSTKLAEVFDTIVPGTSALHLEGMQIDGVTPYSLDINFNNPVTVSGSMNFPVLDVANAPTNVADMTYRQLMDIVNFAATGIDPSGYPLYEDAIRDADAKGKVNLSYDGKINFQETNSTGTTLASIAMHDATTNDFSSTTGSIATFNTNNALTISDAKTDFFKQIDDAIASVELSRLRADGTLINARNGGVQNGIQALDDLSNHLFSQHSVAGVHSQTLQTTADRTDLLIVTTQTLRSDTLDVDFAQASLDLKQLELNYQAMLSTVSRITQLSLVNYL